MAQCDWALWPFPCNDTITQSTSSSSQPLAQILRHTRQEYHIQTLKENIYTTCSPLNCSS